ncbi:hypothetical protein [Pararhizobium haloflavum]|uniref:hypothetical protein n=1 Tax=Pararhizobium haloflavum TaxID=2037914 RepID=UPI000C1783A5|nr:hypothetical protein [Pararhizobium haloflavum]
MKRFGSLLLFLVLIAGLLGPAIAGVVSAREAVCPSQQSVAECPAGLAPAVLAPTSSGKKIGCGAATVPSQPSALAIVQSMIEVEFASADPSRRDHYPDDPTPPPKRRITLQI